ncbi:MAG TPA: EAL domain-containing protein [Acidimicrobiales bacterium]
MGEERTGPDLERHFAGTNTQWLIGFLRLHAHPGTVAEVLRRAGETRSAEELCDDTTWSSYEQFRRLLEAAGDVLGDADQLAGIGLETFAKMAMPDYTAMLQALGSPAALYADLGPAARSLAAVVEVDGEELGETEWRLRQRFRHPWAPFKEYCWYSVGLFAVTPRLFGYPPAEVVEEECACDGAPACVFRVRWEVIDEPVRRAEYWETRAHVLEGRLETVQRTVSDLVSGQDLDDVLSGIVAAAARGLRAPRYLLAVGAPPAVARRVHAEGIPSFAAPGMADRLLAGQYDDDPSCLVVDVSSTRGTYGRFAAFNDGGGHLAQERSVLAAHARLAAAALDAGAAVEEARRQAATAQVLLELSTALAELVSTDEMAARLAQAVPAVVDCDRAVIVLGTQEEGTWRVAATYGYTDAAAQRMRGVTFAAEDPPAVAGVSILLREEAPGDTTAGALMRATGSVANATLPIVSKGRLVGFICAGVTERPERLTGDPDLEDRLRGLAGQAATAISNAELLDQIRHQALHDTLTGLPNRALILERAERMLNRARRDHEPVAALFIDLDNFKDVNDTLGHAVGDELLKAVSARLAGVLRDSDTVGRMGGDTVGRLGGDEFVVLAEGISLAAGPELIAARVQDVLREPFRLPAYEGIPLSVSASIGIATGTATSAGDLLRDADIALYRAKAAGKSCYMLFAPEMQSEVLSRIELEMELRAGVEDQLFVVYQPIFDLEAMRISGAEALLRWRHPTRGVVRPGEFIPTLEETGMITDVGRWILREACCRAASWGGGLSVSVNVSMRQLETDGLIADVAAALEESGLPAASLMVEVTETALMRDTEATVRRLSMLKDLGVRIAVDDFGTGYSSLAYLRRFPVDALKIDGSFVAGMNDSPESIALMHTLVQLGRGLGLETFAEGIEEPGQLARLQLERCRRGQGFLLSRPLEAGPFEDFVARWQSGRPEPAMGQLGA